jgi:hypothetical protein
MGYASDFQVFIKKWPVGYVGLHPTDHAPASLEEALKLLRDALPVHVSKYMHIYNGIDGDRPCLTTQGKWYEMSEEMREASKKLGRDWTFLVIRNGEQFPDLAAHYFHDGKEATGNARIEWDPIPDGWG